MAKGSIVVIQGGQYGSEAKGLITSKVVRDRKATYCVRTGTVNAGHTVYYKGKAYKMQQLPVAWVHPGAKLVIGAGAFIHPDILLREIQMVNEAMPESDVCDRLYIDVRCGLHLPYHTHLAADANRHHSMGATGKGCSEAVVDKIKGRGSNGRLFWDWYADHWTGPLLAVKGCNVDTSWLLNRAYDAGDTIVIEGTQGTMLDLHLGPYPYTTHKQTQAANWIAECGLSCTLPIEVILVMRTYPIRVAGNSGPLPREIGWDRLAHTINEKLLHSGMKALVAGWAIAEWQQRLSLTTKKLLDRAGADHAMPYDPANWRDEEKKRYASVASEAHADAWLALDPPTQDELSKLFERTTVTQKLRRIAEWDPQVAAQSIMLNRPLSIALTFVNYVIPEAWGVDRVGYSQLPDDVRQRIGNYLVQKQEELGVPISYMGFGPLEEQTLCLYDGELGQ